MKEKQITVESVKDGLAKLIREVRLLQSEVAKLTGAIGGFTENNNRPRLWKVLPNSAGGGDRARYQTDEPRSAIEQLRYEYGDASDLEIPTRTLLAISKEIDGALRDIRRARLDIDAIADDSDLRDDFREWQERQKGRD